MLNKIILIGWAGLRDPELKTTKQRYSSTSLAAAARLMTIPKGQKAKF